LNFLHRDITNLGNMEDNQKRRFALIHMYQVLVLAKNKANKQVYQELLSHVQKPLLKRFSDKVEKNRELAALIIKEMFTRVDDLAFSIPYLFPVLVGRLNASNIEGTNGMEEKCKPAPS